MTNEQVGSMIFDFARLLTKAEVRIPLLKCHYMRVDPTSGTIELDPHRNKSWSNIHNLRESSSGELACRLLWGMMKEALMVS
jgi:hypothetical protein